MRILMLGWEYPPHISGGLGTACEGLTTALARLNVEIDFVIPRLYGGENASHMRLLAPAQPEGGGRSQEIGAGPEQGVAQQVLRTLGSEQVSGSKAGAPAERSTNLAAVPAGVSVFSVPSYLTPYLRPGVFGKKKRRSRKAGALLAEESAENQEEMGEEEGDESPGPVPAQGGLLLPPLVQAFLTNASREESSSEHYSGDLFSEIGRYTAKVLGLVHNRQHDLIHAHDWMTFPAGMALKAMTGLPLILHVHSLECDRSGEGANVRIEEIEKSAMEAADIIIAVSYYTRELIHRRHGIPLEKIAVVHNGVYSSSVVKSYRGETKLTSKIVLFLGRVTFQKGPDYFVEAAARVLPNVPDVLFVMAGSGDMLPRMMERVSELGISDKFLFTGFLKGQDVEKMFSLADLYVMPSVSEPFGISALEAIAYKTPVIISKQSGVSEVLSHALKVNFWDVEQLANLIVSVLQYPELGTDLNLMAAEEVKRVHWDASAAKTVEIYGKTLGDARSG